MCLSVPQVFIRTPVDKQTFMPSIPNPDCSYCIGFGLISEYNMERSALSDKPVLVDDDGFDVSLSPIPFSYLYSCIVQQLLLLSITTENATFEL